MKKKHRRRLRFRLRWKDHFSFSVRETRGMFLLLVILSLEITALYYFRFVHTPELPEGWERLIRVADSLDLAERGADSLKGRLGSGRFPPTPRTSPDTLFPFDPNSIAKQEWMALGLSSRQAETVMRYRSSSGGFRIRSDLSRITVIPREKLSKWMPYILLPDTVERYKQPYRRFAVNVNVADSVAFERLKAVGPALAGRICRFRERLGGFQSLEQLREVYGMHDSVWNLVQPQLQIAEDPRLNRIDINRCPEDSLRRHPYIGAALARQMVVYRLQHAFRSVDELRRLPLYSEEISRKLVPYLKVGD